MIPIKRNWSKRPEGKGVKVRESQLSFSAKKMGFSSIVSCCLLLVLYTVSTIRIIRQKDGKKKRLKESKKKEFFFPFLFFFNLIYSSLARSPTMPLILEEFVSLLQFFFLFYCPCIICGVSLSFFSAFHGGESRRATITHTLSHGCWHCIWVLHIYLLPGCVGSIHQHPCEWCHFLHLQPCLYFTSPLSLSLSLSLSLCS